MTSKRRVFLLGGHVTNFTGKGDPDFRQGQKGLQEYFKESIQGALQDTKVLPESIDRVYVGNFVGELFCSQAHLGAAVADAEPALRCKPSLRVEAACASGGLACALAVRAIEAGDDCVLAVGIEVETNADGKSGNKYLARAADFQRLDSFDAFLFPALFAKRAKAYLQRYPNVSMADLAAVAAKAYANSNRNPKAQMRAVRMSQDKAEKSPVFCTNKEIKPFMRLSDCSTFSDGSAAAIFVSEEGLQQRGLEPSDAVEVVAYDQGAGDIWSDPESLTEMTTAKTVVQRMLKKAGVHIDQIDVAEVHDCFTITELLLYEAIGLAEPGKAVELVKSGATCFNGRIPVNPGGGLVGIGHPVGATGVRQIVDVYRQMKGQCGDFQLTKRPHLGLTVNMGGDDKTIATMLLCNHSHSKL